MRQVKVSVTSDFRGQQYVTETTRKGNVTAKRNFEVWR